MKDLLFACAVFFTASASFSQNGNAKKFVLVIHGGAGTILKSMMTPEKEKAYTQGLNNALQAGYDVLSKGGTALDAVEATIEVMEDNPLFNAGKGSVFTNEGKNELDAAIMDGDWRATLSTASRRPVARSASGAGCLMARAGVAISSCRTGGIP